MAKTSKLSRLSGLLNMATIAIDTYNNVAHRKQNTKLSYASIAVSTFGSILDLYLAFKSPRKITKLLSLATSATAVVRNVRYLLQLRQHTKTNA
ncbi:hypothetical protein N9R04_09900 [Staphylococcus sp. SQ8-PEA]|uniref:Uncharacterized protein n=1 Tax=Staphylococcus marylandisciuri TaxID=2981529 RepID=A0ABT2QSQ1_9STAP|nr:hypothetical protein [Staphylococcus marylandisciuri]MCU5746990.1 hypothetical protein [Staphylococcus marylandisciuri]